MTTNADTNDRNFTFDLNVSGVAAALGETFLPEGYFRGPVTDMYIAPEKAGRVIIKVRVAEGPHAGAIRTTGLNLPTSPDDKVRAYWRAFLESIGYSASQLESGQISLSPSNCLTRMAHFYYVPKDEEAGVQYDRLNFYPPAAWAEASANFQPTPRAGAPVGGGSAAVRPAARTTTSAVTPAAASSLATTTSDARSSILGRLQKPKDAAPVEEAAAEGAEA
jgi:hypothetical protein